MCNRHMSILGREEEHKEYTVHNCNEHEKNARAQDFWSGEEAVLGNDQVPGAHS
jgi:hypothetical protein